MPPLFNLGPFGLSNNTSTMQPSTRPSASPYAVAISLTSNVCQDRRVITLQPGEGVQIGRASKSEVKNLQPADDNALFDCPVVSRQHAELRVSSYQPRSEQVTITDLDSLHGTTVNGRRIEAQRSFTLKSGDVIKLGERVTRGDDTHDGISVTFRRLDDISTNHYQVPSPSEPEASDYESDVESVRSIARDPSSAHTTPESNKIKLGSQDQPIFIAESVPAPVIDLSKDEQDQNAMQPAQRHIIPDTYEDDESLVAEEDDVDEGAYVASDNESVDLGSVQASEDQSVVLGDDFDDKEDDQNIFPDDDISDADRFSDGEDSGFVAPTFAPDDDFTAPVESIQEQVAELRPIDQFNTMNNQAQTVNNSFTEPKPRYDPVRNSQPPVENEAPKSDPAPIFVKPPARTYTYDPFGHGTDFVNPATNSYYRSRWDMRPPQHPAFHVYPKKPAPAPVPSVFDNYLNPQPFASLLEPYTNTSAFFNALQQPLDPMPQPTYAPQVAPIQPQISPVANDTTITASTGKISIPSIIDGVNQDAAVTGDESQKVVSPTGNKRKASEMEASEEKNESSAPLAVQQTAEVVTATATPRIKRRRTRRHGTVNQLTTSFAKYTGAAVVGAAATCAFLSSPAAQWVIDYLG
ncbi:hypothetical protein M409DRAFT_57222 [Zasmidium cellare ATCC 36951]|uniref:FHA domain-containing protein n=1 Tax=Zasmidium cellare ATCC 36951 TaxID=1080233 RepID=A0A6A6CBZ0_ZASCE|nr:uncharacterized protein M409DRAFT_57222 [Zasmidium cellare ATCC 36951]KAF2163728.1 hypothetical protein M409DRAFT_57222 [Zasmidium cellare ATCC 36951]